MSPLRSGQLIRMFRRRDEKIGQNRKLINAFIVGFLMLAILVAIIVFFYNNGKGSAPIPEAPAESVKVSEVLATDVLAETNEPLISIYQKYPNVWFSMTDPIIASKTGSDEIKAILQLICGRHLSNLKEDSDQELCWKTLYAMAWQESSLGEKKTGDQGRSIGWFHIQVSKHKTTRECAMNLGCSAEWTLNNLMANGYPDRYAYAVQTHNGWGTAAAKRLEYARKIQQKVSLIQ